jgi:tetratricopeptide (TPR) repeat protein
MKKSTNKLMAAEFPFYGHGLPATELVIWFEAAAPERGLHLDECVSIEAIGPQALRVEFRVNHDKHTNLSGPEWLEARDRFERSVLQLNDVCLIACVVAAPLSELDSLDARHAASLLTLERDAARISKLVTLQPRIAYETLTWLAAYADPTTARLGGWAESIARLAFTHASRLGPHAWSARCEFVATLSAGVAPNELEEWCGAIPFTDQLVLALHLADWRNTLFGMSEVRLQRWLLEGHERCRNVSDAEASFCRVRILELARRWLEDAYTPRNEETVEKSVGGSADRPFRTDIGAAALALVLTLADLDARWTEDAYLLTQNADEAQIVLAEAMRCSRKTLVDRWLALLGDSSVCDNPLVLGNVLFVLNAQARFDESVRRAALHVVEGHRLTPIVITNALNAFAGARQWDVLVAAFAQRAEQLLERDAGRYFLPGKTQRRDLRGSAHAHLALAYGTCGDEARVIHHLQMAATLGFEDLPTLACTPFFAAMANRPTVKNFFASLEGRALVTRDSAITKNPHDWWAVFSRGLEAHNRGDLARAIADYKRVLLLAPDYADTYINMGNIRWTAHNDLLGAIEWYTRALKLAPSNTHGLRNRGEALLRLERVDEASSDLELALSLDPSLALTHYLLAVCHARRNNGDEAVRFAKTGATLDPKMQSIDMDAPYREVLEQILKPKPS